MADEPRYPFLLVDVRREEADAISSKLFAAGATGVEERDQTTLVKGRDAIGITLSASFDTRDAADAAALTFGAKHAPEVGEIVGDAWRDAWKAHFRPFKLADGLVVRPPWETYVATGDEQVLELEPGRAFGTGLHETTSLVAEALAAKREWLSGANVIDVGCGSGILALTALLLGAKHAICIDNDPEAVAVTQENAVRNGLDARVRASAKNVSELSMQAEFVVANIEAKVLMPMAKTLRRLVKPNGYLFLSGILLHQARDVGAAFGGDLERLKDTQRGEWKCLGFHRPA
jgi:ribosomal protein L11 methyltransferase